MTARNFFGASAFLLAGAVIVLALAPWVPDAKEKIAYLIVGNVLSWPLMVLQFFFGASIKEPTPQPVTVTNSPSEPVPVEPAP